MRTAWRLCAAQHAHASLTGFGARLYGGRWNEKGTALVYCSSTLALAALETLVHSTVIPANYVAIRIDIPPPLKIDVWTVSSLPRSWRSTPAPIALQRRGSAWAKQARALAVVVPSAIVPTETNLLINPLHKDVRRLVVHRAVSFRFDPRLW